MDVKQPPEEGTNPTAAPPGVPYLGPKPFELEDNARKASLHKRIDSDFTYHPPAGERQKQLYVDFREKCRELAHFMVDNIPAGRELSRALSDLEDVSMHGNAGIARNPLFYFELPEQAGEEEAEG